LWGDVIWPVEARFLLLCVEDQRPKDQIVNTILPSRACWDGPFPLLDVCSYTRPIMGEEEAARRLEVLDRASEEVVGPKPGEDVLVHHPLVDAVLSAKRLIRAQRYLKRVD
jgi:hypothetical protein